MIDLVGVELAVPAEVLHSQLMACPAVIVVSVLLYKVIGTANEGVTPPCMKGVPVATESATIVPATWTAIKTAALFVV